MREEEEGELGAKSKRQEKKKKKKDLSIWGSKKGTTMPVQLNIGGDMESRNLKIYGE